jgi:hypothetical protein
MLAGRRAQGRLTASRDLDLSPCQGEMGRCAPERVLSPRAWRIIRFSISGNAAEQ